MKKLLLMLTCILLFSQIGFANTIDKPIKIEDIYLQELANNSNQVNNLKNDNYDLIFAKSVILFDKKI